MLNRTNKGFTLIELLIVIAIIALLSTLGLVYFMSTRKNARDTKRKNDIYQIGRFMSLACYVPDAGEDDYDIYEIINELKTKYPQQNFFNNPPRDPKTGTDSQSNYRYIVSDAGSKCAMYANYENANEEVTLPAINAPTPKGGTGIFEAAAEGWNGSNKYYQISN